MGLKLPVTTTISPTTKGCDSSSVGRFFKQLRLCSSSSLVEGRFARFHKFSSKSSSSCSSESFVEGAALDGSGTPGPLCSALLLPRKCSSADDAARSIEVERTGLRPGGDAAPYDFERLCALGDALLLLSTERTTPVLFIPELPSSKLSEPQLEVDWRLLGINCGRAELLLLLRSMADIGIPCPL